MTSQALQSDYSNQFPTVKENQTNDGLNDFSETVLEYPQELGQGYLKFIELNQGLSLAIKDFQNHARDNIYENDIEHEHPLQFYFRLKGDTRSNVEYASVKAGETALCSSGMAPEMLFKEPILNQEVDIHIQPELFKTLFGIQDGAIPPQFKHLFRQPDEEYSVRVGTITDQMQVVLQQIWQCPFEGLIKKVYLEAKVLELIALRLQQDMTGEIIQCRTVKPRRTVVEQIYQAKEILESRIDNPPSFIELAEDVGLTLYQLKQGFQKLFGQSAFQYLHQYRLRELQK